MVIKGSPLLNYIIELGVAGYIDNPNYIASSGHRLKLLEERTRCWKHSSWKSMFSYPISLPNFETHRKYSKGIQIREIARTSDEESCYELVQLRQRQTETEKILLKIGTPSHQYMLLAVDPGQDFLLLFSPSR